MVVRGSVSGSWNEPMNASTYEALNGPIPAVTFVPMRL